MVNAQEWLDKNYPKNVREIGFDSNALKLAESGELIISDYSNLEIIGTIGDGKINNITKLTINNCPQLVRVLIKGWIDNQELTVSNCSSLTKLECFDNSLTELTVSNCSSLVELDCDSNNLIELDINNCSSLTRLYCSNNNLTNLDLTNCSSLVELDCNNNQLTNLKFVQHLTKLEKFIILKNNITTGLQFLPPSLKEFQCDKKNINQELAYYGNCLIAWQQAHPELMDLSLVNLHLTEENTPPVAIITTSEYFLRKVKKVKPITNKEIPPNFAYSEFHTSHTHDNHPLVWEKATSLPLRLYNLQTKQVEKTEAKTGNYAILSYVWGQAGELSSDAKEEINEIWNKVEYVNKVNPSGYKSLHKAIEVCKKLLGINYLWMDQLCINQHSTAEKNLEVPKMRQYYNQATATLIAIDGEIGERNNMGDLGWTGNIIEQIVISPWFTRAWTFQEGLLSKQTIFMFDDGLVDGRDLARAWAGMQDSDTLNHTTIFSTPLGWSLGSKQADTINLGLSSALESIKHRQQTVPLDGVYSILGLLPYGDKVKPKYKKFGESYSKKELEQALQELMNLAIKENTYEAISWFGERRNDELWFLPQINEDGSTNIEGFVNIIAQPQSLQITKQGIFLVGQISSFGGDTRYDGRSDNRYITILPNPNQILSDKLFEILVPKPEYVHLPIKLLRSVYANNDNIRIFIDMINKQVITDEEEIENQMKSQIQIPPK